MKILRKGSIMSLVIIILSVAALIALIHYAGLGKYFTLEYLQAQGDYYRSIVQRHYFLAVAAYLAIFIVLIALVPVVIPLALMGGFLFGLIPGFLLSLCAATIGSVLAMITIRYFLAPMLRTRYKTQLDAFDKKITQYGPTYLLTLQLLSVIPYFVTDILAALTSISVRDFTWAFAIGNIPLIFILTYAGQHLATIHSFGEILTTPMLLGLAALALLASLPAILRRFNINI
ncbi:MAG: VTT domain-containing protein [Candidatus Babeliales bacterium]|nr:VTT domain-containing protein [Candidatus Babeliales bacterium]